MKNIYMGVAQLHKPIFGDVSDPQLELDDYFSKN